MAAIDDLDDRFRPLRSARPARHRTAGRGLLDNELGAVIDYGATGTWLRVPLGKLATERVVPLDETT